MGPPLTVTAVAQVGPDDVFLREAEDPQAAPPHGGVQDHIAVGHQLRALVKSHSVEGQGTVRREESQAPQSFGILP